MTQKNTKNLEKRILENTDRLIESAIATSLLSDEAREKEFYRGVELVREIATTLKELIEVKDEYLPEILNQIISQKLPDIKVQQSLGSFSQELDNMVKSGIRTMEVGPEFEPKISAFEEQPVREDLPEDADLNQEIENQEYSEELESFEEQAVVQSNSDQVTTDSSETGFIDTDVTEVAEDAANLEKITVQVPEEIGPELWEEPFTGPSLVEDIAEESITNVMEVEDPVHYVAEQATGDLQIARSEEVLPDDEAPVVEAMAPIAHKQCSEAVVGTVGEAYQHVEIAFEEPLLFVEPFEEITIHDGNFSSELESVEEPEVEIIDGISLGDLLSGKPKLQEETKDTPIMINLLNGLDNSPKVESAKVTTEEPKALAVTAPTNAANSRNLDFSLRLIFPGVELLRDVCLDGVNFAVYLPTKRLAFDQEVSAEDHALKEKICNQEGITYLVIAPEDAKNPRRVERLLQRRKINTRV